MSSQTENSREVPNPRLLILTGPQGSGNHLWSKIFNSHPDSYGWDMKKFWEGHHKEPFADCWNSPVKFVDYQYKQLNVTSISNPYVYQGRHRVPRYNQAFKYLDHRNVYYTVALLSRDKNVLKFQQERVRKDHTVDTDSFPRPDIILSFESLMLYGETYLQSLSDLLGWPIDIGKAMKHVDDTNKKYIKKYSRSTKTDKEVYKAIEESKINLSEEYKEATPVVVEPPKPLTVLSDSKPGGPAPKKRGRKKLSKAMKEAIKKREKK
jgi:hypothetical protein